LASLLHKKIGDHYTIQYSIMFIGSERATMPAQRAIELEELQTYFRLPEKEVAKRLGICLTSLKKVCRSNGIYRWPYRKVRDMPSRCELR